MSKFAIAAMHISGSSEIHACVVDAPSDLEAMKAVVSSVLADLGVDSEDVEPEIDEASDIETLRGIAEDADLLVSAPVLVPDVLSGPIIPSFSTSPYPLNFYPGDFCSGENDD